jgi:sterol desaturase/sphingolipid hydroxylase (fatty acid hydroxylase superfamily)
MHLWHHDVICHYPYGQNFAVVFSIWDWIFKTMYYPSSAQQDAPEKLGFHGLNKFPDSLITRLLYPFTSLGKAAKSRLKND